MRNLLRTTETAYPLQSQRPRGLSRNGLFQTLLVVLVIDATLTAIRGVDFVRYVFTESRFALVGVVLWLGLSALSLFLVRRFRTWAAAGFPQKGRAFATTAYAYVLFAVVFGLTLEYLAGLVGVDWLETGGDEPNHIFTAVGLTITSVAFVMTVLTIRGITKTTRASRQGSFPSPDAGG